MINSFAEARLGQIFFRYEHSFTPRELGELIWTISQENILAFLANIPEQRQHRVRFEDLVSEPERIMRGICEFAGMEYQPEMIEPYREKKRRMSDGLHKESRMLGDVKFHEHAAIDAGVGQKWKKDAEVFALGDATWTVAEKLGYEHQGRESVEFKRIDRIAREEGSPMPLSFAQRRMWFLDQLEPGNNYYNISTSVRLKGDLKIAALESALNEIVRRHDALRTIFVNNNGEAKQVVQPAEPLRLAVQDLSHLSPDEQQVEAYRRLSEETERPFNLSTGPLLRALLLQLGKDDHAVVLTTHHIVADGWSTGVLMQEIATLYKAYASGRTSPLPELPVQYADYAHWQREWLQGPDFERQLSYWRGQLGGELPVLNLKTDHPRPSVQSYRGAREQFMMSKELTAKLKSLSQAEGCTLFITLLAAFQTLLFRHTGQDDIIVGSPVAGRNRKEVEGLIGLFLNMLVLRTDLSGNPPFNELLQRVRKVAVDAFAHQEVPFEKIVEELQPDRDASRSPFFQVAFGLQNIPSQRMEATGLTLSPMAYQEDAVRYDLTLWVSEVQNGLRASWTYNTALFEAGSIRLLQEHFELLLHSIVDDPEARLTSLDMMTASERRQLESKDLARDEHSLETLMKIKRQPLVLTPAASLDLDA
jgi:hypothetical protein